MNKNVKLGHSDLAATEILPDQVNFFEPGSEFPAALSGYCFQLHT
jgi:hypothetical protein